MSINGLVLKLYKGGPRPAPRPRSEFADFTPPAAEPLARMLKTCPMDGQVFNCPVDTDARVAVIPNHGCARG